MSITDVVAAEAVRAISGFILRRLPEWREKVRARLGTRRSIWACLLMIVVAAWRIIDAWGNADFLVAKWASIIKPVFVASLEFIAAHSASVQTTLILGAIAWLAYLATRPLPSSGGSDHLSTKDPLERPAAPVRGEIPDSLLGALESSRQEGSSLFRTFQAEPPTDAHSPISIARHHQLDRDLEIWVNKTERILRSHGQSDDAEFFANCPMTTRVDRMRNHVQRLSKIMTRVRQKETGALPPMPFFHLGFCWEIKPEVFSREYLDVLNPSPVALGQLVLGPFCPTCSSSLRAQVRGRIAGMGPVYAIANPCACGREGPAELARESLQNIQEDVWREAQRLHRRSEPLPQGPCAQQR